MSQTIQFEATPYNIGTSLVLRLPKTESLKLPSRGQVMITGTVNGFALATPLEPDGEGSHWLAIDDNLQASAKLAAGKPAKVSLQSSKDWPEPTIPIDVQAALKTEPQAYDLWQRITPMARWDWIRWIGSTKEPTTRQRHVTVAMSKLNKGERRPCCFNRNMCCVPNVSKSGVLLGP